MDVRPKYGRSQKGNSSTQTSAVTSNSTWARGCLEIMDCLKILIPIQNQFCFRICADNKNVKNGHLNNLPHLTLGPQLSCSFSNQHQFCFCSSTDMGQSSQQLPVFEIKGAPCTLCAHFGCRVHGFRNLRTRCLHDFLNF